ncbi:MAG: ankyrin repeat domain-containing protein [Elusimicrobiota bacterium]
MLKKITLLVLAISLTGCATPLMRAAKNGDAAEVGAIIMRGETDPDRYARPMTLDAPMIRRNAMYYALYKRHHDVIKTLLRAGSDPNKLVMLSPAFNPTPLYVAVEIEDEKAVRILLDAGADPNKGGRNLNSPLQLASIKGSMSIVQMLLKSGGVPDDKAINAASDKGYSNIQMLLAAHAPTAPAAALPRPSAVTADDRDLPPVLRASFRGQERPADFAVIVGIGSYSNLPAAEFGVRDAETAYHHFRALGIPERNIIRLSGDKAVRSALVKYVNSWLPRNVGPTSRVYFYFSGHGAPNPVTGEAYLIPWDGDPNFLKDTGYPIKDLYRNLESLKAREVIAVLDACFSGAGGRSVLAKGARPLVMKVNTDLPVKGKLTLFTAANGLQITTTLAEYGHGMFTYYFFQGLNGAAVDEQGRVTARGLFNYLKPRVQDEARRQNRDQTPTYDSQSDVVLRAR